MNYYILCSMVGEMGTSLKTDIMGPFHSPEAARNEAFLLGMSDRTQTVVHRSAMTLAMMAEAHAPKINTRPVKKDPTRI